ncbi:MULTISPECIES: 30S ribosomal protein S8 [Faecalicoccus]|jgi:small subunit ribosomal protein S8|uniref:Small ribosomal subunit protein uS8 n=1 Tax=Faecalicoccus pleomorphus TaxID=1323 RepID=A0A380LR02_9FIRM|nr:MULTISPECIES: 30S ribosomal protein S8 [Faecalicoccus]MBE6119575.1 30S ribosomal protein S8 [Erysipelotrichaceae bacterium]MBM6678474.1 30S ribosomal protein S8 [Faecalicoccus pleomorphus]MBM6765402.1 30S ribosomal protein S8 [Faecalicoccus pleomorphus]MBM6808609.1 30S ribosomal protein S8 [Faecalicoccus pleomorphus]MCI6379716.1 30S ribosomal protein S8 [Erysipelotrichaceae bacterium]
MIMTDPIADMLTRIRNALQQKHETVSMPVSKEKKAIAEILKEEGYITDYKVEGEGVHKDLTITLKYTEDNKKIISGLRRISKPGLRVYAQVENLPRVLNGLGIAIISTSNGMMTDKNARKNHLGGEVIAYIW